jgi:hypothetical protein
VHRARIRVACGVGGLRRRGTSDIDTPRRASARADHVDAVERADTARMTAGGPEQLNSQTSYVVPGTTFLRLGTILSTCPAFIATFTKPPSAPVASVSASFTFGWTRPGASWFVGRVRYTDWQCLRRE